MYYIPTIYSYWVSIELFNNKKREKNVFYQNIYGIPISIIHMVFDPWTKSYYYTENEIKLKIEPHQTNNTLYTTSYTKTTTKIKEYCLIFGQFSKSKKKKK